VAWRLPESAPAGPAALAGQFRLSHEAHLCGSAHRVALDHDIERHLEFHWSGDFDDPVQSVSLGAAGNVHIPHGAFDPAREGFVARGNV
jgi:hypothetical protein